MSFPHYDNDTLTDVRSSILEAYNYALMARFCEEGQYQNLCSMIGALQAAAIDLGFDLVKRTENKLPLAERSPAHGEASKSPDDLSACHGLTAGMQQRVTAGETAQNFQAEDGAGQVMRFPAPSLPCDCEPPEAA